MTSNRPWSSGAVCSPAYTRIGSLAGLPLSLLSSAACGPVPTKVRPWYPKVLHGANDVGLPDFSASCGCDTPAGVALSCGWKTALAPAKKPRTSTPSNNVISSATTIAVPMNSATSSCTCQRRISIRASSLTASMSTRNADTSSAQTTAATISVRR